MYIFPWIANVVTLSPKFTLDYWTLAKDGESRVFDKDMQPVLPMMECESVSVYDETIKVTMPDYTMRKYDLQGNMTDDFFINDFDYLEYELEDTYRTVETYTDEYGEEHECLSEPQHRTARARLCIYKAGCGMEGLMTVEGHVVTMPKYECIAAVGPDTYLCTFSNGGKEIVNGEGQKVR